VPYKTYKIDARAVDVEKFTVDGTMVGMGGAPGGQPNILHNEPKDGYVVKVNARIVGMMNNTYRVFVRPGWKYEEGDHILIEIGGKTYAEQGLWEQLESDFGHRLDDAQLDFLIKKIMSVAVEAATKLHTQKVRGRERLLDI